jgi:chromosome segregation ATPase
MEKILSENNALVSKVEQEKNNLEILVNELEEKNKNNEIEIQKLNDEIEEMNQSYKKNENFRIKY